MDENALPFLSQMIEGMVFEDVVPQRNESRGTGVHHKRALFFQESLHKQIELPLVNASFPQKIQTFHPQTSIFREGLIHWICVNSTHILTLRRKILRQDGRDQTLSHASLPLQRYVNRRSAASVTACLCH